MESINIWDRDNIGDIFSANIFKCIFFNEDLYFDSNVTEICFQGPNWQ